MYEKHTPLKSVVAHYVTDDRTALWKTKIHSSEGAGTYNYVAHYSDAYSAWITT